MKTKIIRRDIEGKSIVWFEDTNQYIIVEPLVAEILLLLHNKTNKQEIITHLFNQVNIPYQQAANLVTDIETLLISSNNRSISESTSIDKPNNFEIIKYYVVNNIVFKVSYATGKEAFLIHPKFAHLEVEKSTKTHHHFEVYSNANAISFTVDGVIIGTWNLKETHYFQGKFSMELVQKIHHKSEDEWMGVFHASAVSNGTNAILCLGDSGNGKSTSLALLQANGFTCLADDFVPIDATNKKIYSFPAAISIKKNSIKTLLPFYPNLETAKEYNFKNLNKIVRFLPPNTNNFSQQNPCKALLFIKYEPDSDLKIDKISKLHAFQQLVPDSWLSPSRENAEIFLDWFDKLPCYQLTYSDNEKMITTVKKSSQMNYKETLLFVGKCLTITHEIHNRVLVEEKIKANLVDWDAVVKLSTAHYVFPALYCNFKRVNFLAYLPTDLVEYMKHITDLNRERNQQIIEQAKEINELLRSNNITPVFLKGTGNLLEGLYEDIAERMVGDIDFIVSQEEYQPTIQILNDNNYVKVIESEYDFPSFKHHPRLQKKEKIAAVEIHKELLIEKYADEFNYEFVSKDSIHSDSINFLSYQNQLSLSIIAKQINDDGQFYNNISLRNAYDVFLLSKKVNPLEAISNYNKLFIPLNNFLAITRFTLNSETVTFKTDRHSSKAITLFNKGLIKPSKKTITRKKLFLQKRINIISKAFSNKEIRTWLFKRISDREWIRQKLIQLGLKKLKLTL
ncbi:nucleotidyltransferase family protein [Tenacibaculum tangerinum]|uniref:Nucleotidyltransferase family protein n=1 Tax=Tenacibaculum tangerinum TaxID=3038772 RepID=A0ABY8L5J0_9FLAO|nr:nucleotidyltransferase family protein [Tenacibaculum tangerinum]WGH75405.1 nucleotidyltransferase family protein [Tenacibaculum tangerinum]